MKENLNEKIQKNRFERERGITLIVLVITIIVLLILAGASIAMLTGENGMLTQATSAKEKTTKAEEEEKVKMAVLGSGVTDNGYSEVLDTDSFTRELQKQFGSQPIDVHSNGYGSFIITVTDTQRKYYVNTDKTVINSDNIVEIGTPDKLKYFRDDVNAGNNYEGKVVLLTDNIDLNSQEWDVIGSYTDDKPFAGIFDGNSKAINGLNISKNQRYVGFFSYNKGTIRNIVLESGSITGARNVGAIVGKNKGIIENCSNSANITSETSGYVGGICGNNYGKIRNSYNTGIVKGMFEVGGITGGNSDTNEEGVIEYCYNLGDVIGTGEEENTGLTFSGGISGHNFGKINYCYNMGNIEVKYSRGGGIVGIILEEGEISNCYNIGEIKGNNIGNIAGRAIRGTKISNCYFSKEICNLNGVGPNSDIEITETIEKTVDYMKTNNFVNDLNKDEEAFSINSSLNEGFPVLKWQVK